MYLTRARLNIDKNKTKRALTAPNLFHGAVESCFAGERKRNLWRIDILNGIYYILILSRQVPDLEGFVEQFGYEDDASTYATKKYQTFVDSISDGQEWRFRLVANPTSSIRIKKNDGTSKSKIVAHITPGYQKKWLMRKAEANGFLLKEDEFDVVRNEWITFNKRHRGEKITMLKVTYEGTLKIKNQKLFKKVLTAGLGREKAFGMGMLTVVRAG